MNQTLMGGDIMGHAADFLPEDFEGHSDPYLEEDLLKEALVMELNPSIKKEFEYPALRDMIWELGRIERRLHVMSEQIDSQYLTKDDLSIKEKSEMYEIKEHAKKVYASITQIKAYSLECCQEEDEEEKESKSLINRLIRGLTK